MLLTENNNRPRNITIGVHCANSVKWLWDLDGIDLAWEHHLENCKKEDHTDCEECQSGPVLYGNWTKKNNEYSPSRSGEMSAIFNPEFNTVQVIRSTFAIRCNRCSPCYPNQGDADTDGDQWAYCLPPDYMDEVWINENVRRIYYRKKTSKGNYYWKKWKR